MRLFDAIVGANQRRAAPDSELPALPDELAGCLPVAALTCVDPRLNAILPKALGLPADQFVWLRNAGNIVTHPLSSTMRSLALACAVKGARELAIIGHTDCQVCKTTTLQLLERLKAMGIERHLLPENINEFFGLFASEQQNVIKACGLVRQSPLIGPSIPVHGLLANIETGRLEWLVNGYHELDSAITRWNAAAQSAQQSVEPLKSLANFQIGEMKFPETKIGEMAAKAENWLSHQIANAQRLRKTEN